MIPLYFLNKDEATVIKNAIYTHVTITGVYTRIIVQEDIDNINNLLRKRLYLSEELLTKVTCILTMNIIASEKYKTPYSCDIMPLRKILLKLLASHKELVTQDFKEKNAHLWEYLNDIIKKIDINEINHINEKYIYNITMSK